MRSSRGSKAAGCGSTAFCTTTCSPTPDTWKPHAGRKNSCSPTRRSRTGPGLRTFLVKARRSHPKPTSTAATSPSRGCWNTATPQTTSRLTKRRCACSRIYFVKRWPAMHPGRSRKASGWSTSTSRGRFSTASRTRKPPRSPTALSMPSSTNTTTPTSA